MKASSLAIEAVLFDFDGTLVETENIWKQAKVQLLSAFDAATATAVADRFHGVGLRTFAQAVIGEGLLDGLTPEAVVAEVETIARSLGVASPPLKEGARSLIEQLVGQNVRLAICSNAPADLISQCLRDHGLRAAFSAIFSTANTPLGKPNPHVYQRALRELELSSDSSVAVEDSASGVKAAIGAGLPVVLIGEEECSADVVPTKQCGSLCDVNYRFLNGLCLTGVASESILEAELT